MIFQAKDWFAQSSRLVSFKLRNSGVGS